MKLRLAVAVLLFGVSTPALASARLPGNVAPTAYDITITPDAAAMSFGGRETVHVAVRQATRTIVLNANDITLGQVTFDGRQVPFTMNTADQQLTVTLPRAASVGEHVMTFTWNGRINTTAAGFFAIDYTNDDGSHARMLATQFEAPDARRFAPTWDEPAFKARFTLNVMAPGNQTAFSNMPAQSVTRVGANRLYRFQQTPLMSSYLLFLGIGDIERRTVMAGPTEIGIITRRGVADRGTYALDQARRILTYYNDYFGQPYPLPKLDMIAAPGDSQVFSAMENWGAIFYFEDTLLFDPVRGGQADRERIFTVIAHETAHQWFGDLVTMRWWDDLWLNEGFASWMESRATADLNPTWQADAATVAESREGALGIDATAATHPIIRHVETVDQLQEAFDGITYSKGEAVIRMLETTLGRDTFRAGIRRYEARYHYGNTDTDQLWAELEAAAGRPVTQIAHDFTLQAGVPLVTLTGSSCAGGRSTATLTQTRFGLDAPSRQPQTWHVPLTVGIVGQPTTSTIVSGPSPQTVTTGGCGTLVLNRDKGSYMRARYDDPGHAAIVRDFGRLTLNDQLGTMGDDYALALSGDQPLARYLAVQGQVRPDADPLLWQTVAGRMASLRNLYDRTPLEQPLRQRTAAILRPAFDRVGFDARPGESTQTANLRSDLIGALAVDGDPVVGARVRSYVAALRTNPRAIPAPIRRTVLSAFAFNANAADWDMLHAMAQAENDPVAKNELVRLLGVARDDAQAQRALTLLEGNELTDPQKATLLRTIGGNHPDLAFDYAVAHQAQVNGFLEGTARAGYIIGLGRGSNDPAMPGKITAYANASLPEASRTPARQAVALMAVRRANADRLRADVQAWLGQPAG